MTAALSDAQKIKLIESSIDDLYESALLAYDWRNIWARPNQIEPQSPDWFIWLILAGRGFGKTRTGAEWVREKAMMYPGCRIALVAPTSGDARDILVEGESGILSICPPWDMPKYEPSKRRLTWKNGSRATLFSAEEPERLRGPQHHFAWGDELCAWAKMQMVWDMLMFGLRLKHRLGSFPKVCLTTTPKPVKLLKSLMAKDSTIVTRGSTHDNKENLAEQFYQNVIDVYAGTRIGRQEVNAEILEDNLNALWTYDVIDRYRLLDYDLNEILARCIRVVVAVDPAVSSNPDSDETGIVIVGRDINGRDAYVIDDRSLSDKPHVWARVVAKAYKDLKADRVVAEVNNGGDLVERNITIEDPHISYESVHATRGKIIRAEPISALYEQGRVHHLGYFKELEDQMCDFNPLTDDKSPDRMDAVVWGLTHLFGDQLSIPKIRSF